jgi:hypothetical protein
MAQRNGGAAAVAEDAKVEKTPATEVRKLVHDWVVSLCGYKLTRSMWDVKLEC